MGKGITQLDYHKAFCANAAAVIAVVVSTIFQVICCEYMCLFTSFQTISYSFRYQQRIALSVQLFVSGMRHIWRLRRGTVIEKQSHGEQVSYATKLLCALICVDMWRTL